MTFIHARRLAENALHLVLLVAAAVALYLLAAHYALQRDLTQNAGNSLEPASVQALGQLPGPLRVLVFSPEQDARLGDMRKLIRRFVGLYQRHKSDITLEFIDPAQHPDEARRAEIQANGEMVVEYAGRREHLSMLNEQNFTGALLNLAHRRELVAMYVDGHGERKLDGIANFDLGEFGKQLGKLGFRIASLNLAVAQDVPDNASLLVITQPEADWLPGERDKLLRFVDRGGNILWLLDAEPLHGLGPLADKLGLALTPGILIDPDAEQARAPATWTLGANYPPHAITRDFRYPTVFPFARALDHKDNPPWRYCVLVDAAPRGWVTAAPVAGNVAPRFNKQRDTPGPKAVALALERDTGQRTQRIVVVGSGAFLSNMYSGNGRNLDLGVNMVNWLSQQDNLIAIPPRAAKDDRVSLSKTQLAAISIGLVIGLPLVLALGGGLVWWRRRG